MSGDLIFFQESLSKRAAKIVFKKFGDRLGSDAETLIAFHQALRRMLWQYNDIDETSALVGCEFAIKKNKQKEVVIEVRLVKNDKKHVVVKNEQLAYCVMQMFASKIVKEGKIFFHWKHIEEFEEKLNNAKKEGSK